MAICPALGPGTEVCCAQPEQFTETHGVVIKMYIPRARHTSPASSRRHALIAWILLVIVKLLPQNTTSICVSLRLSHPLYD